MNCDQHISTVGLLCWRAAQGFMRSCMWHACPRANYAQLPSSSKDARMDQSAAVFQAHGRGWYGESQSMRALPDHDLPCLACRSWKRSREVMIACMYVCMCVCSVCMWCIARCTTVISSFCLEINDAMLPAILSASLWATAGSVKPPACSHGCVEAPKLHMRMALAA